MRNIRSFGPGVLRVKIDSRYFDFFVGVVLLFHLLQDASTDNQELFSDVRCNRLTVRVVS